MKEILSRFSLDSAKIGSQTISIAVFLYCILVACVIWSINVQPFNKKERSMWTMLVVMFGPLAIIPYLAVAWKNAATGSLSFWRKPKRGR